MPATLLVQPDPDAVAHYAAELLIDCAEESIRSRGRFRVALSGGGTPGLLYRLLAGPSYRDRVPWPLTEMYWGDERHLPAGDQGRNDTEVLPLLAEVGVPRSADPPRSVRCRRCQQAAAVSMSNGAAQARARAIRCWIW